jgi:hypothetical protein
VVRERRTPGQVEPAGEAADAAEDLDRGQVEVSALAPPRLDQLVDLVLLGSILPDAGTGRES